MTDRARNLGHHSVLQNDLTGKEFGRLRVIERAGKKSRKSDTMWRCECRCGNIKIAASASLRRGRTASCGCLQSETSSANGKALAGPRQKHKATYSKWAGIIKRCFREYDANYARYGAAGISVCQRWRSFAAFIEDMGDAPPGHSIDRMDYNGHYSCGKCFECLRNGWPSNCRWATNVQQQRNRSTNRVLTFNGVSRCVAEWADEIGMSRATLFDRLNSGWSVDRALTTPARRKSPPNKKTRHGDNPEPGF